MFHQLTPIPRDLWLECFTEVNTRTSNDYWHLLLIQKDDAPLDRFKTALIPFFESALSDARQRFLTAAGISLDPLGARPEHPHYPGCLPLKSKKALFGEVFCALVSTFFPIVTNQTWRIPEFLFRNHNAVGEYIFRLRRAEPTATEIPGRTGNDFLALSLNATNRIQGFLVAESKCHATFSVTASSEAHERLCQESMIPVSLGQLKEILIQKADDRYTETIAHIDGILFDRDTVSNDRTDLFLYIFENPGVVTYPPTRIPNQNKHAQYTSTRPLQAVEIRFRSAEQFITALYEGVFPLGVGNVN